MRQLAKYSNEAYALMRMVIGFLFAFHGAQKLFGIFSDYPVPAFASQAWIGGVIELVCGLLVTVGLMTRAAAFLASGEMAVAYFQFHWKFQMGEQFFPAVNKGEPAVIYCFVFLFIACYGGVKWCLDKDR